MQITKLTENRKNLTTAALIVAALLPLAALSCRSGPPRGAASAGAGEQPAPLVGEAMLGDDGIRVQATVAFGGMPMPGAGNAGGSAPRPPAGGMPMGGPPAGGGLGGPPPLMGGGAGPSMAGAAAGGMRGVVGGPSHALSVVFTNLGAETVEFTIIDVKSRLGDFLPQPDTLALAPGQQGGLYPMRGTLPDDIGELELTVAIRMKDGRTETRVLLLKPSTAPAPSGGP